MIRTLDPSFLVLEVLPVLLPCPHKLASHHMHRGQCRPCDIALPTCLGRGTMAWRGGIAEKHMPAYESLRGREEGNFHPRGKCWEGDERGRDIEGVVIIYLTVKPKRTTSSKQCVR